MLQKNRGLHSSQFHTQHRTVDLVLSTLICEACLKLQK